VGKVAGAETLDFRDVQAFRDGTVFLLSIGKAASSRIYKSTDSGEHWTLLFTNPDDDGFFDAMAFWDENHAIVVGDPVGGKISVFLTADGGKHWERSLSMPPALAGEGAFAASGTCVTVAGKSEAWIATGGAKASRVYHTSDAGATWSVAEAPLRNDGASAGAFSLDFFARFGIVVGGDYNKAQENLGNIAVSNDGGKTWSAPGARPAGFRSAVAYVPERKEWVVTGTSGSDVSTDGGATWKRFDNGAFNALGVAATEVWAVGPRGRVARLSH